MNPAADIRFEDVTKTYRSGRRVVAALETVDVSCPAGRITAVLGPSGCGKTTLLRLAAGLASPSSGRVTIDGTTVDGPGRGVGLVSQEGGLLPWRRAASNIELGLEIRGIPAAERRARSADLMARLHLDPETAESFPAELSGGQRRRLALARALAPGPGVLLMDEPFAALDEFTRRRLRDEVIGLWQQGPVTILLVTHSIEEAVYMADHIVILAAGRVAGSLENDLDRPRDLFSAALLAMQRRVRDLLPDSCTETPLSNDRAASAAPTADTKTAP